MKLRRFSGLALRNLRARPQRTVLTTIGIVLGVGIVFGVLTLSETMSRTFTDLYGRAFGAADLVVTARGGSGGFDEGVVERVRGTEGVRSAAPRLSVAASLIGSGRTEDGLPEVQSMRLFGVERETAALATGFELESGRLPRDGREITLDSGTARAEGLELGDRVRVGTPTGPRALRLVGLLQIPGGTFGGSVFAMAPLPFAQEAFDRAGQVSGISVASEGPVEATQRRLDGELGEGLQVERSEVRTERVANQFQGFGIALLFFAGTALFVGAFLVFNALSMTVLERTRELGMLRALGSTRGMVGRSVVLEAALLGLLGSAAGLLFGYGMARGLVLLLGNAFLFRIEGLSASPFALLAALAVGVVVTVLAALYPAARAGRVSPVEAMRARGASGSRGGLARSALPPLAGLLLIAVAAPWVYYLARNLSAELSGWHYASGIAGVIGVFLGVSLLIPALVRPMAWLLSPPLRLLFGVEGRMAAANATRNRARTALTASALMVGVALVIAFSALGGSVLGTIKGFLDDSLGGDYVVRPSGGNHDVTYSPELARSISELPGVERTTGVASNIISEDGKVVFVFGLDREYPRVFRLNFVPGSETPPDAFSRLEGGSVLVGRRLAESRNLRVGERLELATPGGTRPYPVAGIVENDVLGGGSGVYLADGVFAEDFRERGKEFLAIKAERGSDRDRLTESIAGVLRDYPQFSLLSNAEWKEQIERDFDRQYVFFYAIMGVSVAVSAFGVVNTLSMSVFERTREIGILRAVGMTRLQVGRLVIDEGVVIGLIGCLVGVAVGSLLGYLFVMGTGAGGFEVEFYYPRLPALGALAAGLLIGVLAGLLPARTAARKRITEAIAYE